MVLVIGLRKVGVGIVDIGCQVDEDGAHQRLPAGPVIRPETKQRRGHHLTKTVGGNHPAQEAGVRAAVDLQHNSPSSGSFTKIQKHSLTLH